MLEFDPATLKVVGREKILINGGTDISKKPVWIEGPHIFKKDGWYYLICAEGGTANEHSEVVFRSKSMDEPFTSYQGNPILTQRHLDPNRRNPITSTGHAEFVTTPDGKWYAVFLGCRPYKEDYYNIGRETFMAPVTWKDGWPVILEGKEEVQYSYPVPMPAITKRVNNPYNGYTDFTDEFNRTKLNDRFMFLRTVKEKWYSLTEKKGFLTMKLRPETGSGNKNPSFIAFRQPNNYCGVTTLLYFEPHNENEKAGLTIFQNETHFYYLCKSIANNKPVVQLYQSTPGNDMKLLATDTVLANKEIYLRIQAKGDRYSFLYTNDTYRWHILKEDIDGTFLSTKVAGGFVGSVFALYATSLSKQTGNKAYFNWFKYWASPN